MACRHLVYTGGINPFGSDKDNYHCDLCGKSWDWKDSQVENVCKNGDKYEKCPIWIKYAP